jgi:hypothetical protein
MKLINRVRRTLPGGPTTISPQEARGLRPQPPTPDPTDPATQRWQRRQQERHPGEVKMSDADEESAQRVETFPYLQGDDYACLQQVYRLTVKLSDQLPPIRGKPSPVTWPPNWSSNSS